MGTCCLIMLNSWSTVPRVTQRVGEMEQGPEGIPCQREPVKQVGREYGCPRVARSEQGEEGRHDMGSLRAWHCLPPANLCK